MQLPDFGQLILGSDPILIFVAVFVGLFAFFLVRMVFRTLNVLLQLGVLVVVALGVLWLLQTLPR